MKKIMSLLLCVSLLLCSAVSFAQEAEKTYLGTVSMNGAFELRCKLPEGYAASEVDTGTDSGIVLMSVASEDPEKPTMLLSVAFDELLSEVDRLNDLDAEALSKIEATFQADDQVKISYCETAQGTKLMMVREVFEDMALIATVGCGMNRRKGVSAKLFGALADAEVNMRMIEQGSSEINIIVGVEGKDFGTAVRAIYDAFA